MQSVVSCLVRRSAYVCVRPPVAFGNAGHLSFGEEREGRKFLAGCLASKRSSIEQSVRPTRSVSPISRPASPPLPPLLPLFQSLPFPARSSSLPSNQRPDADGRTERVKVHVRPIDGCPPHRGKKSADGVKKEENALHPQLFMRVFSLIHYPATGD